MIANFKAIQQSAKNMSHSAFAFETKMMPLDII